MIRLAIRQNSTNAEETGPTWLTVTAVYTSL